MLSSFLVLSKKCTRKAAAKQKASLRAGLRRSRVAVEKPCESWGGLACPPRTFVSPRSRLGPAGIKFGHLLPWRLTVTLALKKDGIQVLAWYILCCHTF